LSNDLLAPSLLKGHEIANPHLTSCHTLKILNI
jgi:hypothetical protein